MNADKIIHYCEIIYRKFFLLLMAFAATSLLPSLYLLKSSYLLWKTKFENINKFLDIVTFLGVPIVLSIISLIWMKRQANDSANNIVEIEPVNNEYLPIYLGYIFVSVSIPNPEKGQVYWLIFIVIYLLIVIFVTFSQSLSFNPILILFGYGYYRIKTQNGVKVFLVTCRKIDKCRNNYNFDNLSKITELFYMER